LFYKRGEYPGLLLGGIATLIYLSTFITSRFERWRKAALTITLVFFIGPGLLINGVFKETWGRPRPRTIEQFGGTSTFKPFYKPDFSKEGYNNKSFPSGHVAMAFMFLTVALVAKRERVMWLCYTSFIFACAFGVALAYVRIAQGGHYLSDTIISALLMWLLSVACCRFVYGPKK
jgi:lipid A 4'-phosphatase